jgi:hypothetical protein
MSICQVVVLWTEVFERWERRLDALVDPSRLIRMIEREGGRSSSWANRATGELSEVASGAHFRVLRSDRLPDIIVKVPQPQFYQDQGLVSGVEKWLVRIQQLQDGRLPLVPPTKTVKGDDGGFYLVALYGSSPLVGSIESSPLGRQWWQEFHLGLEG